MIKLAESKMAQVLANQIQSGEKHINNMSEKESSLLLQMVVSGAQEDRLALSKAALSPVVEIYQYDDRSPFWFEEGTTFEDDIWQLSLTKSIRIIDFNVKINDGELLTSIKHRSLLNAFKYWLVAQGNPRYNGGKILKPVSIYYKVSKTIHLINSILINAEKIKLAQLHLYAITPDFVIDILSCYSRKGIYSGIYRVEERVREYLLSRVDNVTDKELNKFEVCYPYIKRMILDDEDVLSLSGVQYRKACCYLYRNGAYLATKKSSEIIVNGAYFKKLYSNVLSVDSLAIQRFTALDLKPRTTPAEYPAIPVRDDNEGMTADAVSNYLKVFKTLSIVNQHSDASSLNMGMFKSITLPRIKQCNEVKATGRFSTLPVSVVFKAIKDAFEFALVYTDDILNAAFSVIVNKPHRQNSNDKELIKYKESGFQVYLPPSLIQLGVTQWSIQDSDDNCYALRRANRGFVDVFNVLMGAIQILVGATMARRQGELLELGAIDCLLPSNKDPNKNKKTEFELIFDNRKSGIGGESSLRESLSKPILNSVAGLIYKLQVFNKKLIDLKVCKYSELSLFNNLNARNFRITRIKAVTYCSHLDAFCDYFETEKREYTSNDVRRFYIRQHQLRRFFAMVFFWSKSFDGLDTLRHFLGHTDSEHLYYYVTEGIAGEVLAGVKAGVLLDYVSREHIENIEKLEPILRKYFKTKKINIRSLSASITEYDDDFSTCPPITSLKEKNEYEVLIAKLITGHVIDLKPEFFTLTYPDGSKKKDFHLVLHVYDK